MSLRYRLILNRRTMKRPSHKELNNKILQAKEAVAKDSVSILDPIVIAADAISLCYLIQDINEVLLKLLAELTPGDYAGKYPPQKSYMQDIIKAELFAFKWTSQQFGCATYFKFAFAQGRLWVVSLHEHRKNKGG